MPSAIGPYEMLAPIGRGGAGTVFRVRAADGAELALKLLHLKSRETIARFALLDHERCAPAPARAASTSTDLPALVVLDRSGRRGGRRDAGRGPGCPALDPAPARRTP